MSDKESVATADSVEGQNQENADRRIGDSCKYKIQDRVACQLKTEFWKKIRLGIENLKASC
jgi:hypothetical protein